MLFSVEGWASNAMHWLSGESSAAPAKLSSAAPAKLAELDATAGGGDSTGGGGGDAVGGGGESSPGGDGDNSGDGAGVDSIPCEADCSDEEGGGSPSTSTNRGDGDSSSFDLASEDWEHAPNPRPDQLPQGASRNTWPNIVNNKKNVRTILRNSSSLEFLCLCARRRLTP